MSNYTRLWASEHGLCWRLVYSQKPQRALSRFETLLRMARRARRRRPFRLVWISSVSTIVDTVCTCGISNRLPQVFQLHAGFLGVRLHITKKSLQDHLDLKEFGEFTTFCGRGIASVVSSACMSATAEVGATRSTMGGWANSATTKRASKANATPNLGGADHAGRSWPNWKSWISAISFTVYHCGILVSSLASWCASLPAKPALHMPLPWSTTAVQGFRQCSPPPVGSRASPPRPKEGSPPPPTSRICLCPGPPGHHGSQRISSRPASVLAPRAPRERLGRTPHQLQESLQPPHTRKTVCPAPSEHQGFQRMSWRPATAGARWFSSRPALVLAANATLENVWICGFSAIFVTVSGICAMLLRARHQGLAPRAPRPEQDGRTLHQLGEFPKRVPCRTCVRTLCAPDHLQMVSLGRFAPEQRLWPAPVAPASQAFRMEQASQRTAVRSWSNTNFYFAFSAFHFVRPFSTPTRTFYFAHQLQYSNHLPPILSLFSHVGFAVLLHGGVARNAGVPCEGLHGNFFVFPFGGQVVNLRITRR